MDNNYSFILVCGLVINLMGNYLKVAYTFWLSTYSFTNIHKHITNVFSIRVKCVFDELGKNDIKLDHKLYRINISKLKVVIDDFVLFL